MNRIEKAINLRITNRLLYFQNPPNNEICSSPIEFEFFISVPTVDNINRYGNGFDCKEKHIKKMHELHTMLNQSCENAVMNFIKCR